jgi:hypothetical protein
LARIVVDLFLADLEAEGGSDIACRQSEQAASDSPFDELVGIVRLAGFVTEQEGRLFRAEGPGFNCTSTEIVYTASWAGRCCC